MARPPTGQVLERRTGRGRTYALRFRAYGKRHYVNLGTSNEGYTHQRAEEELANVLADVRRGIWKAVAPEPPPTTPVEEPTFHVLASEWVERRRHEVDARTVEHWRWALSTHLLPFLATYLPSQITTALIERFKAAKLAEREERLAALERWQQQEPGRRGPRPPRPLGNASINKILKVLAQVLDDAVEFGYLESNVARGKRRRLKAGKPRRTWLELHEVQALLAAAKGASGADRDDDPRRPPRRRAHRLALARPRPRGGQAPHHRREDRRRRAGRRRLAVASRRAEAAPGRRRLTAVRTTSSSPAAAAPDEIAPTSHGRSSSRRSTARTPSWSRPEGARSRASPTTRCDAPSPRCSTRPARHPRT